MDFLINWLISIPVFATPFALATLGLIICERSGVLNLGAEGFLLVGAMAGAASVLSFGGLPLIAIAMGGAAGAVLSLLFGFLVITLRINQVVIGLTIVFFAQGLTALLVDSYGWSNKSFSGLRKLDIPLLSDIPVLGRVLFHHDIVVYLTVAAFAVASIVYYRTNLGLRLRSVGENPEAADSSGVPIGLYRYGAVLVGCALVGMAGSYLAVGVSKIWVDGMSGGRGWIAIALVIFARWRFWRALGGAILFGCIEALIPRIAAVGIPVPQYFLLMMPYVVTLGVMVWASMGKSTMRHAPGGLGRPFVREERS